MLILNETADNHVLIVAISAWGIAQVLKVIVELLVFRRINFKLIKESGGMPSSHASAVSALATMLGFTYGFNSGIFAFSVIMGIVVMYDAAGVRRSTGTQAKILNELLSNLENSKVKLSESLKERIGHTPIEVITGSVIGIFIALVSLNFIIRG
jgi:hypothetical protein